MNRATLAIAILLLASPPASRAQDAPPPQAAAAPRLSTGAITGTIYCADTDLPARLAVVHLIQGSQSGYAIADTTTTDLDGRFVFNHVEEGNYYVVAVLPGYEDLMSIMTKSFLEAMASDDRKMLLSTISSVAVTPNQPGQISIRLDRGAAIEGTVTWDDGSPAIGLHVSFALKSGDESNSDGPPASSQPPIYSGSAPTTTDDRGHFRILGVLPAEYVVSVSVPVRWAANSDANPQAEAMQASIGSMEVYVGGGQRASKAETIKVTLGGASRDADITIPISRMHTIRGQVLLKSTNQPPSSATVRLLYADTREPARSMIAPNGEFEFHYVPEDSFILRAAASPAPANGDESGSQPPMGRYSMNLEPSGDASEAGAEIPLAVTSDMDGVSISVPDAQPANQNTPSGVPPANQ